MTAVHFYVTNEFQPFSSHVRFFVLVNSKNIWNSKLMSQKYFVEWFHASNKKITIDEQ